MEKQEETRRAKSVKRRLPTVLKDLGYQPQSQGGCIKTVGGATCRVGLQKLSFDALFRVILSFEPPGGNEDATIFEVSDPHTCTDSPSGRKYNFNIRWGDDAVDRCLREIHDFVMNVADPWFEHQARSFGKR